MPLPRNCARDLTKDLGGRWHGSYGTACCPAHDDRKPSLSIRQADGGKLLVKCHGGCPNPDVWAVLKDRGFVGNAKHVSLWPISRRTNVQHAEHIDRRAEAKTNYAKRIWAESRPAAGTPVEH